MVSLLCLGLLVSTLPSLYAIQACSGQTNGYCVSRYQSYCPPGMLVRYTGCGLLEQCCYTQREPKSEVNTPGPTCGVTDYNYNERIVGGAETVIEKYPWMASVRFENYHRCGASILNKRWLVTGAHCFFSLGSVTPEAFTIIVGSTWHNYFQSRTSNLYKVQRIITHALYRQYNRSDIALIQVDRDIDLSGRNKKSICLPEKDETFSGQKCVVTGWGLINGTSLSGSLSPLLREVTVTVVNFDTCFYYMGNIHRTMLCAGETRGGRDACQGDSGGPLACMGDDKVWKLVGIVSYGFGCAEVNRLGIYTKVSMFYDWIHQYVNQ